MRSVLRQNHFDLEVRGVYFFQLSRAKTRHNVLPVAADSIEISPTGREMSTMAGLKMNAITTKAMVMVYLFPADSADSNMATSR